MAVEHVTDADFDAQVLASEVPVLVDFWAPWCGPCKMIGPVVEELAVEYEGRLRVAKLNVDENRTVAGKFGVRSIPTIFIFRGGDIAERSVGAVAKDQLKAIVDKVLEGPA